MFKLTTVYAMVFLVEWVGGAAVPCGLNQYTVKIDGKHVQCVDCIPCPRGMGTVPQCGAFLTEKVAVMCKMCVTGLTYSRSNDVTSCQPCTICVEDEVVIKNCTLVSNTVCGKCKKGYYRSFVYSCEKCAECCGDPQEQDLEKKCLNQGLPRNQACRNTGQTCKTTRPIPTNTHRILTQLKKTNPVISWYIVGVAATVIVVLVIIIVILYRRFRSHICFKKRVKSTQETTLRIPDDREILHIPEDNNWRNPSVGKSLHIKRNYEANKSLDGPPGL